MSRTIFLSPRNGLAKNWQQAFPDALCLASPDKNPNRDDVVFIDRGGVDAATLEGWLLAVVALKIKVIVLSPVPDDEEAVAMIKQGAMGYGHSFAHPLQLQAMREAVSYGGLWLGDGLMQKVLTAMHSMSSQKSGENRHLDKRFDQLSEREVAVAREVARGATNQEIADLLAIKERTVKAHITALFGKLSVRNRVELALLFNRHR